MTLIPSLITKAIRTFAFSILSVSALVATSNTTAQTRNVMYRTAPAMQRQAYPYGYHAPVAAGRVAVQRQVVPVAMIPQRAVAMPRMAMPAPQMAAPMPVASNYLTFNGRYAQAPSTMPIPVQNAVIAGNNLQSKPYVRGGGHQRVDDSGYDCSGSVSFALIKAGLLRNPLSSKDFANYGESGPGRFITIYVKPGEHVFMSICGLRFDTSGGSEGQGPRWRSTPRDASGFIVRHPFGL